MLVETGKKIFCLSLDTGKQSGTFRPLISHYWYSKSTPIFGSNCILHDFVLKMPTTLYV